jgi:hypothetical protein
LHDDDDDGDEYEEGDALNDFTNKLADGKRRPPAVK